MVTQITTPGRSGVQDWFIQRVSALILAAYFIFLLVFFICHPDLKYSEWHDLFENTLVRIFTLGALVSLLLHAWIGLWIVSTDYIKPLYLRTIFQLLVIFVSLGLIVWGILILWGL